MRRKSPATSRPSGVAEARLCCGCGVCAGVARCGTLQMRLTSAGHYVPEAAGCAGCCLCPSVCPGLEADRVAPEEPLGSFLDTVVGYSLVGDERSGGSSGGLATRVLKALLDSGEVAAVVGAASVQDPEPGAPLFEARVLRSVEEVDRARGTKYYPIEFSSALQQLRASGETFALVGLPCVVSALRRGQDQMEWLGSQCRYLIGLACGHLVTTHYTTFLAAKTGVALEDIAQIEYRYGHGPRGADDYSFLATRRDGTCGTELHFASSGIPAHFWRERLFTPPACFRCADLFAVDADLTLMDAWLPEYREDRDGTSLAVARSEAICDLLDAERRSGRAHLESIDPERVIASQAGGFALRCANAALMRAEAGGPRLPLKDALRFRWVRARSALSNRLLAGGPRGWARGILLMDWWLRGHRAMRRLRSLPGRLLRRVAGRGRGR